MDAEAGDRHEGQLRETRRERLDHAFALLMEQPKADARMI
jgi:hypothetical protein